MEEVEEGEGEGEGEDGFRFGDAETGSDLYVGALMPLLIEGRAPWGRRLGSLFSARSICSQGKVSSVYDFS